MPVEKHNLEIINGVSSVTREFWLLQATKRINDMFFGGEALLPEDLQVAVGFVKGSQEKILGQCALPNLELGNTFPSTIVINHTIEDPVEILGVLVHECIHAMGIKGHGKQFAVWADKAGLERPHKIQMVSDAMREKLVQLNLDLTSEFGPYPGTPLQPNKEKKERQSKIMTVSCPECEYKVRVSRDLVEKYGAPLCPTHNVRMIDDAPDPGPMSE